MHVIMMIYNILYKGVFLLGVLQAHGVNISQVKNYNSIHTIKEFSIAEYYYEEGRKTIDSCFSLQSSNVWRTRHLA